MKEQIKQVQIALGLVADGIAGPKTWTAIANRVGSPTNDITEIQRSLKLEPDGIAGPKTWAAISSACITVIQHEPSNGVLSDKALKLILEYEVGGGEKYYNRALRKPTYPGGASGVTIGIGYDLGYNSLEQFTKDWSSLLSANDFASLAKCLGKTGTSAKASISAVKNIEIPWNAAYIVFTLSTIPRFVKETVKAFPNCDKLHPDAFGALVSLVFNRGSSLSGDKRREMKNIHDACVGAIHPSNIYTYIADQLVSMKRLWIGKGLDGLLTRRNAEADLIRACA